MAFSLYLFEDTVKSTCSYYCLLSIEAISSLINASELVLMLCYASDAMLFIEFFCLALVISIYEYLDY